MAFTPIRHDLFVCLKGVTHNTLLRGVVKALTDQGFVPPALAAVPGQ